LGSGLALPLLALVAAVQVQTVAASPHKAATDVNRALKGDRLPMVTPESEADSTGARLRAPTQRLPDGCEAAVSPMTRSPLARTPARCVS
jgi:hypothetical protein